MNKKDFKELLKKCFGKQKDTRYHAIAMLIIYGIFMLILIITIRVGGNNTDNNSLDNNKDNQIVDKKDDKEELDDNEEIELPDNDINYSYSYTITFDGNTEVYLGKKIDDKEKFSYIKDNTTYEYAIKDGTYLMLKDGTYHIIDTLDTYFKYCDMEKIFTLIEKETPTTNSNEMVYSISNYKLSSLFSESLKNNNNLDNTIELLLVDDNLKEVRLDLDNYISSVLGSNHILNIKMEFANIGTTEDFEIKMN